MLMAASNIMLPAERNNMRWARGRVKKCRIRSAARIKIAPTSSRTRIVNGTRIMAQVCSETLSTEITSGKIAR